MPHRGCSQRGQMTGPARLRTPARWPTVHGVLRAGVAPMWTPLRAGEGLGAASFGEGDRNRVAVAFVDELSDVGAHGFSALRDRVVLRLGHQEPSIAVPGRNGPRTRWMISAFR